MNTMKKQRSFRLSFKLKVIEFAKAKTISEAARKFKIDRKCVRDWMKKETSIVRLAKTPEGCKRKSVEGAGRKVIFEELEAELLDWIAEKRKLGEHVSRTATRMKARILYDQINDVDKKMFKASEGWLQKFMERNGLSQCHQATPTPTGTSSQGHHQHFETSSTSMSSAVVDREIAEMDVPVQHFPLTTHVLDTSLGVPGKNVHVSLFHQIDEKWHLITESFTNTDGRCPGLISAPNFKTGIYKLHFDTGKYFKENNVAGFYPFVEVVFEVKDLFSHYHVPLIINPYSYSTYRGS